MREIHFSVDDTIEAFLQLPAKKEEGRSIFDVPIFAMAKQIHERFGVGVSFYCMYTNGTNTLKDVSDGWRDEFQENADWLKFGFHAYDKQTNYCDATKEQVLKAFDAIMEELKRITGGGNCITDIIRIHFYAGNSQVVSALVERGVRVFLCADDDRISYGLTEQQNETVLNKGYYISEAPRCIYTRTYLRAERLKNFEQVQEAIEMHKDFPFLTIFTHEVWMSNDNWVTENICAILKAMTQ